MSAVPLRILEFSSHEPNSVQSWQFSNRLFSRRLCIFHFPTKKSKSFGDDVNDVDANARPDLVCVGPKLSVHVAGNDGDNDDAVGAADVSVCKTGGRRRLNP